MEASQINNVIAAIGSNVKSQDIVKIQQALQNAPESAAQAVAGVSLKNPTTTLLLSIFLGAVGGDRFYLGQTGLGIAKALTCGGIGIWGLIDLFITMGKAKDINLGKILEAINAAK